VGAHSNGRVIDVNNALEEGPFTPERAGDLPTGQLVELCFSGRYTKEEIKRMLVGRGGLMAYTGTTDCKELVEKAEYDETIRTILDSMIYRIAREIYACAAALNGKVDRIVITGGLAFSDYIVQGILNRVRFLGPVSVLPGEDEMTALADGVLRVLEGKEKACVYE
jgi:butyrate kinase